MTSASAIMTMTRRIVAPDLFAPNDVFAGDHARKRIPLAAVSWVSGLQDPQEPHDRALRRAAMAFLDEWKVSRFATEYHFWFVAFDGGWVENTAIARKYRFWGNYARYAGDIVESVIREASSEPVEIEIRKDSLIKYAGMARLTLDTVGAAGELVRGSGKDCFIFVSSRVQRASQDLLRCLYDTLAVESSSGEYSSINWTTVAGELCALGDGVIRASGSFDDRDAAIDLMVHPFSELGAIVRCRP